MYHYQTSAIQDMNNFLAQEEERLYRLYWDCGLGKSYTLARFVALHPELNFLYVTVTHKICNNFETELLDAGVSRDNMIHFHGKKDLCLQAEEEMYYPGCRCGREISRPEYFYVREEGVSYCKLKCPYKDQPINKQVVLTVFELMGKFSTDDQNRVVIIDESPEKLAVKQAYAFSNDIVLDQKYTYEDRFGEEHTYYERVQPKVSFHVHDYRTWKLQKFFEQTSHAQVVAYPHKRGYNLYGRNHTIMPPAKVIFACATTSIPYMEAILGLKADRVNDYRKTLLNTVIEVNHQWTKSLSEAKFEWFSTIFLPSLSNNPNDIFVSTKKMFAEQLTELGYNSPYHGNGRGINDYNREYKFIISYCRFGAPIEVNDAWVLLGFNTALIKQREVSESLQTFHRCRAHLHSRYTPIILMTNKEMGIDANIEVSLKVLEKITGLSTMPPSLNKIATELHISKRDAKPARETFKVLY